MKKIIILLITIVVASIAAGVVTGCKFDGGESTHEHKYADAYTCHDRTCTVEGCGHVEKATTAHKFADEFTCHDRTCKDCGSVEKATTKHKFADEFTCHDRTCTDCGSVEKATTEHSWGEWVTVREPSCTEKGVKTRECDNCGDTETADLPAKGHTYADEFTCHDRVCTVEDCGHIEKATTAHNFGDWQIVKAPTCTEEGLKERICSVCGDKESEKIATEHSFGEDGVCTNCNKNVKEFFITSQTVAATVTVNIKQGKYSISSTDAGAVYAVIRGNILTELKKLGYTTLSFTASNPAPGLADDSSKVKPVVVAADSKANLDNKNTAIAFYNWQEFWDADNAKHRIYFTIDLNEYAGRDIYIYTEHTDVYPLDITVDELAEFDYEDKSEWLFASAGDNGEVTYLEGKGWVIKNTGTEGWYCQISGKIMKHYIDQGCTRMVITYVNNLEGEANTDEGSFVKTASRLIPLNAAGGNDWMYQNTHLHLINALPEGNGGYMLTVDLTDKTHDFTNDNYFYFDAADADKKTVSRAYISDISFQKGEPEVQEDKSGWIIGNAAAGYWSSVEYIKGKGWIMRDITNGGAQGEYWLTLSTEVIQKKISEGYTKMTIIYANSLDGVDNPNEGNFINTGAKIAPTLKGGSYTLDYVNGNINQYCTEVEKDGVKYYEHRIDLTDATVDFAQVAYIICYNKDAEGKKVTCGYIADIVFEKDKPEVQEDKSGWIIGNAAAGYWSSVEYIKGKGWIMRDITNGGAQGEYWLTLSTEVIQKKISEGYTKMTIIYANSLDGVDNPNEGNFINTGAKIAPTLKGGSYTLDYVNGNINQYCTEVEKDGVKYYEHRIDLTDATVDFAQVAYIICYNHDAEGKKVTCGYIADIVFSK